MKPLIALLMFPLMAAAQVETPLDFDAVRHYGKFKCSYMTCDFRWKSVNFEMDYDSVCYDRKGYADYQDCRQAVVGEFMSRCEVGRKRENQVWVDTFCAALDRYRP